MNMKKLLVTGSSGLIGSEVCIHFASQGWKIHGVDNNQRAVFFGPQGDTRWNQQRLEKRFAGFAHHELDIRDRKGVLSLVEQVAAGRDRSHGGSAESRPRGGHPVRRFRHQRCRNFEPAGGRAAGLPGVTVHPHVHQQGLRRSPEHHRAYRNWRLAGIMLIRLTPNGIAEDFSHRPVQALLFGASKVAADVMVQEYGRYFGMPTCCLRGGCLTGPNHSGVELHGFLSYLVKCNLEGRGIPDFRLQRQTGPGQHPLRRCRPIHARLRRSARCGEVYNIGGGKREQLLDPRSVPDR